jgi:hypothetical protein
VSGLEAAFPTTARPDAAEVVRLMPTATFAPVGSFGVRVDGEPVTIPYRLYHPEPVTAAAEALPPTLRTMLSCLYTRHHDGYVRQRHLRLVVEEPYPWVAPFVVRLLSEYVIQIVVDIRDGLARIGDPASPLHAVYRRFAAENREFLYLTQQRATSYWNCYYRSSYPRRQDYPAAAVLGALGSSGR